MGHTETLPPNTSQYYDREYCRGSYYKAGVDFARRIPLGTHIRETSIIQEADTASGGVYENPNCTDVVVTNIDGDPLKSGKWPYKDVVSI